MPFVSSPPTVMLSSTVARAMSNAVVNGATIDHPVSFRVSPRRPRKLTCLYLTSQIAHQSASLHRRVGRRIHHVLKRRQVLEHVLDVLYRRVVRVRETEH